MPPLSMIVLYFFRSTSLSWTCLRLRELLIWSLLKCFLTIRDFRRIYRRSVWNSRLGLRRSPTMILGLNFLVLFSSSVLKFSSGSIYTAGVPRNLLMRCLAATLRNLISPISSLPASVLFILDFGKIVFYSVLFRFSIKSGSISKLIFKFFSISCYLLPLSLFLILTRNLSL